MSNSLQKQNANKYAINKIRHTRTTEPSLRIKFHKTALETPHDSSRHDRRQNCTHTSRREMLPVVPLSPRHILSSKNLLSPRETALNSINITAEYQRELDDLRDVLRKLKKQCDRIRLQSDQYLLSAQQMKAQLKQRQTNIQYADQFVENINDKISHLQQQLDQITNSIDKESMDTFIRQNMIDNLKASNVIHKKNLMVLKQEADCAMQHNRHIREKELQLRREIQRIQALCHKEQQTVEKAMRRDQQVLNENQAKMLVCQRRKSKSPKQPKVKAKGIRYAQIMLVAVLKSKIRRVEQKGQPFIRYYLKIRSQVSHGFHPSMLENPYDLQTIMASYPEYQDKLGQKIAHMQKYQKSLEATSEKLKQELSMQQTKGHHYLESPDQPSIHVEETLEKRDKINLRLMKLGNWAHFYKNILKSLPSSKNCTFADSDYMLNQKIILLLVELAAYREPALIEVQSDVAVSEAMKFKQIMRVCSWSAKSSQSVKRTTIFRRDDQKSHWRDGLSERTDMD